MTTIREGVMLIVEGPVIEGPREPYARFFYRDVFGGDRSNWWVPTLACLPGWIECSCFEVVRVSSPTLQEVRAVTRKDPQHALPDEDLERYDRA